MSKIKRFALQKDNFLTRLLMMTAIAAVVIATMSLSAFAETTYMITDGDTVVYHTSEAEDLEQVLSEAGLELGVDDIYTTEEGMLLTEITIQRVQMVTIDNGGQTLITGTYGETVQEVLERLEVTLDEDDEIDVAMDEATYDGMHITISRITHATETYSQTVPYGTDYVDDPDLPEGYEKKKSAGKDGEVVCTANVTYVNGEEVSREVVATVTTTEPVNEVIALGSAEVEKGELFIGDGVIVTPEGDVYTYTGTKQVKATAYTHTDAGCNKTTATGTTVHWGTVAVDPKVIPYGTRMYIVSNDGKYVYGYAVAEDCGGAIKNNKIDLYMPTKSQCYTFGVRNCTIYFLG